RLDQAEAASAVAVWNAAVDAGVDVSVVDDGDLAMAAAPDLPGAIFNLALGFAHLPNLIDRAVSHFAAHRVTGGGWTDAPPWPDAILDSSAVTVAMDAATVDGGSRPEGLVVRELGRGEVGAWSSVIAAGADLGPRDAAAFAALEPNLALAAHHHRFIAELDGTPVGAASLHVHHHVGWLRSGTVLPAHRGRGIQRAMIEERLAHAERLGCDLVGSLANADSSSARNLERVGGRVVATRGRYRVVPAA
ncbi:MAG TPA: GNAT family N-acetyltransferase, partial [Candidatus Limnocylindria bacterium]